MGPRIELFQLRPLSDERFRDVNENHGGSFAPIIVADFSDPAGFALATIYLVRHGEASAHWTEALDAELSVLGHTQAADVARVLAPRGPAAIYTSPLRRARGTAAPLEAMWQTAARVDAALTELPTQGAALAERSVWLNALAAGGWPKADPVSREWRRRVLDLVTGLETDAVIFTHFVAINAVLGAALERDEVYLFRPANASITVIENDSGRLRLIERGAENPVLRTG
jgi:broad specificity phosphatase PhoE